MFSIIVPAYNVEKYLERCIESIINQTYKDFEIIIVDDGSTDNTGLIANRICERYPEMITVIHQRNKGLGGARNTGIENATGEYLLFIDSDDYIGNDLLEKAYKYLNDEQLDIFVYQYKRVKEADIGFVDSRCVNDNFKLINSKEYLVTCSVSACNKVYRRNIFIEEKIRYPEKLLYEDIATTPMTAVLAKRIGVVDTPLYYYVQREGSIISSPKLERIYELHTGYDRVLDFFAKHNSMEEYSSELEFLAVIHAFYFTNIRVIFADGKREDFLRTKNYLIQRFSDYKSNKYLKDKSLLKRSGVEKPVLDRFLDGKYISTKIGYLLSLKIKNKIKEILNK